MGVLDELALSGVDRVERRLGTRAALRMLVPLLDTMPAGGRARGLLRAIHYAAAVDEAMVSGLCDRWAAEGGKGARAAIRALLVEGHPRVAARLAEAEAARTAGSREEAAARYALGRCLEATGQLREAREAHGQAARLAGDQPRLRQSAGAREVRALLALGERDEAAHRAARLLPLELAADEERLAVAVAALESPGRYRRVAALDVLELLARRGGEIGRAAVRFAAWHAERSGAALRRIEADRIAAVLAEPEAEARLAALMAGAAVEGEHARRVKAVLGGGGPGPRVEGSGRERVGWLALAACAAVLRGEEARSRLEALAEVLRSGARVEAPAWTAASLALGDEASAEAGRALAEALLARDGEPPPRGYASLGRALDAAGAGEAALEAWRRAAARREPGAREHLALLARWRGWEAAREGDAEEAIARLREARRLAGAERD